MTIMHRMVAQKMKSSKTIVRAVLLALLTVACVSVISARAQEQPASSEQNRAGSDSAQKSSQQAGGPARQLERGSKEAAGEEKDEYAEFKQSASVRGIARLTGLGLQQSYWLSLVLNFVVIAGAMIWAARKYLPGLFRDRTAGIQKAMQEAQKASEEARGRLAEIESRLLKLDSEIDAIREAAEKEGAAEAARIKAAAEEEARKIVSAAEQEISAAGKAARRQLTAYAADLAVGLARKQIRVDAATDQALVRNFAGQLGASDDSASGKDRN